MLGISKFIRVKSALVTCESVISPCVRERRVGLHERGTCVS